jgi:methyl-accepting chemotaxis protein
MAPYNLDSATIDSTRRATAGGWRSLLGNRLLLALLAVSLIPLALMGIATYRSAANSLTAEVFAKLETVRTITAKSVERYFQTLHNEIRVLSEDRMAIDACKQFKAAITNVLTDNTADDKAVARSRRELDSYYVGEFATEYRQRTSSEPVTIPYVEALDDTGAYLQNLYLRNNEHAIGSKLLLDAADDQSTYSKVHA